MMLALSLVAVPALGQQTATDSIKAIMQKAQNGDATAQNTVGSWCYTGRNGCKQSYAEALKWWTKAAKQGNAMAIGNMGMCYQTGHGIARDSMMASQLYDKSIQKGNVALLKEHERLSEQGKAFSSMYVAHSYKEGIGVKKDAVTSARYYIKASGQGSVEGTREGALALLNGGKSQEAVRMFKKGLDAGDLSCTYWYGKLLFDGKGIKQDREQGVLYMMKAAEHGMPAAMYQVGECYREGLGIAQDDDKAVEMYHKAAALEQSGAEWELAMMYKDGHGTARDYQEALYWFAKAAAKGYARRFKRFCQDSEAENWTATDFMTYLRGMKAYRQGNISEAAGYFKKLEKAKVEEAMLMTALCNLCQTYDRRNEKKAIKSLHTLSSTNARAKYELALCYDKAKSTERDAAKAVALLQEAAEAGYGEAQCYLGDMLFEGRGTPRDYQKAVKLYNLAWQSGHLTSASAKRLATCYEYAWGTEKNTVRAEAVKRLDTTDHIDELLKLF